MRWRTILSRLTLVALGVLFAVVSLEVGMRSAGYLMRFAQWQRNQQALTHKHQIRVLCIGESTTAGLGTHGSYPEALETILNHQSLGVRFAVANRGRIGATTDQIIEELAQDLDELKPDLVVAMLGINDPGGTSAYGSMIGSGSQHWFGSFRLYKLYRLIRSAVERELGHHESDGSLLEGQVPREDPGHARREHAAISAFPSVPEEVGRQLSDAKALIERNEYEEAEALLNDLLRNDPGLPKAYVELAQVYRQTGRQKEAHRLLLRGVENVSPPSVGLHNALGRSQFAAGDTQAAIRTYRLIIDTLLGESLEHPTRVWDHTYYRVVLATIYEAADQPDLAEQTLAEIVEQIDPWNDIAYRHLIEFHERHGAHQRAAELREAQARIRREHINPKTRQNLGTLRQMLRARGIPLVAVQYPGRSVEALERTYDHDSSLIYVGNEFFKHVERSDGYDSLYVDRFAGDFGHLTEKGKHLLANNIARAIVEDFLGRSFNEHAAEG